MTRLSVFKINYKLLQLLDHSKEGRRGENNTKIFCKRLQSTKGLLPWAELSFSVTFPGCGSWLHAQSLKTETGNTVEIQLEEEKNQSLGEMFSISALISKRKMSLRHSTDQMSVSLPSLFFQVWLLWSSCQSWSKLTVPSGYQDPPDTLALHSQFSQQCCFHTAGSLLAVSHTPLPSCTWWQAPWLSQNTKTLIFSSQGTSSFRGMPLLVSFLLMAAALYGASHRQIIHYQIRTAAPKLTGLEFN